ncbi:hypothetical protein AB0F17_34985 [Nonomuraea sp. NPDC026600]|uniref:hypothetical protein n=1 Tax=Nonomuraea sp. NPDC026600 TaxID=3155363 RepID=UPI0034069819
MGLIQWERYGVRFTADGALDVKAVLAPGDTWQPRDWRGRWIWMGGRVQLRGRNRYGTVIGGDQRRGVTIAWDDDHTSTVAPHLLRVDTPARARPLRAPRGDALFDLASPPATSPTTAARMPAVRDRIPAGAWAPAPDGAAPDQAAVRYLARENVRAWLTETNGSPVAYLDQNGDVRRYIDISRWEADVARLGLPEADPPRGPADGVLDPDASPTGDAITHVMSPDGVVHAWMVRTTGGAVGYVRGRDGRTRRFAQVGRWRLAAQSEGVSVTARRATPSRRSPASPAFEQTPIPDLFGPAPVDALPHPASAAPAINVADLVPGLPGYDEDDAVGKLRELIDGATFGGLTLRFVNAAATVGDNGSGKLRWRADIFNASGRRVGSTDRIWHRETDGTLWAKNDFMSLRHEVRGNGFAAPYSLFLERHYWNAGFSHVAVDAGLDDGGYVWASAGFDFADAHWAARRIDALRELVAAGDGTRDELAAARALLDRADRHAFGEPGFPSAREISQVGRRPGQNFREQSWIGSRAMRGSGWNGIKRNPLLAGNDTSTAEERATPERTDTPAPAEVPPARATPAANGTVGAPAQAATPLRAADDLATPVPDTTPTSTPAPPAPARRPRRQGPPISTLRPGQRMRNGRYGPVADITEVHPNGRGATVVFTDGSTRVLRGPNIPISFVVTDETPTSAPPPTPARRTAAAADPGIPDADARPERANLYFSSPDGPGEAWIQNDGRTATFHVRGRDGIVRRYTNTVAWANARDAAGATEPTPAPTPAARPAPHIPDPPPGWLAGDVIPRNDNPDLNAIKEQLQQLVAGRSFNGFAVNITGVTAYHNSVTFGADILDANGRRVGRTERKWIRNADGTMYAYNKYLELDEHARGGGFAPVWGAYLEQIYWESGFDRVEVLAALEDGGYVWASAGFDFKAASDARELMERLSRLLTQDDPPWPAAVRSAARALLARAERHAFGEPGFPSARELSQLGRQPGQNIREHSWLGMALMRGRMWSGVKRRPQRADV